MAPVAGWTRFKAAQDWIDRNAPPVAAKHSERHAGRAWRTGERAGRRPGALSRIPRMAHQPAEAARTAGVETATRAMTKTRQNKTLELRF